MNALNPRLRFQLRGLTNLSLVIAIFTLAAFVFAPFPWAWVADAIAAALLLYVFFHVIEKRAIGLVCGSCQKHIASNVPWLCGICQKPNTNVDEFPFLHRCAHCSAEPKAYKCHHCEEIIFLTQDKLAAGCARWIHDSAAKPEAKLAKDEATEKDDKLRRKIKRTELEAELEEKKRLLNQFKSSEKYSKKSIKAGVARTKNKLAALAEIDENGRRWHEEVDENSNLSEAQKKVAHDDVDRAVEEARHEWM